MSPLKPCVLRDSWKFHRLTVPANPLPFEIPVTATLSPNSKFSTVRVSPSLSSGVESVRNSFKILGLNVSPAFLTCADTDLLRFLP